MAKWNESAEGTVKQRELEQSAAGENETLKDASGQSTRLEGDAGQTKVAGDASRRNEMLVDSITQKPLGDGAAGQEAGVPAAVEGSTRPGKPGRGPAPWREPTQGPVWQNETAAPAVREEEMAGNAAGQNQTGERAGHIKPGAAQSVHDGLSQSSDWGSVSSTPQLTSLPEHSGSRITGGTLCHRGHCPWQVIPFSQSGCKCHTWMLYFILTGSSGAEFVKPL